MTKNSFIRSSSVSTAKLLDKVNNGIKANLKRPEFRVGDTVRVHARIVEGQKERIQVFEGMVIKRSNRKHANATFTVRKVSFNVGVERTFYLFSPRVESIDILSVGSVRRSKLFYLRPLRGRAARIKSKLAEHSTDTTAADTSTNATKSTETAQEASA